MLDSELEFFKTPDFMEMDDGVLMSRSAEIGALKILYDKEISARVEKVMQGRKSGGFVLPLCMVCQDESNCADTVLPCGHLHCSKCTNKLLECSLCRTLITHTTRLYGVERVYN